MSDIDVSREAVERVARAIGRCGPASIEHAADESECDRCNAARLLLELRQKLDEAEKDSRRLDAISKPERPGALPDSSAGSSSEQVDAAAGNTADPNHGVASSTEMTAAPARGDGWIPVEQALPPMSEFYRGHWSDEVWVAADQCKVRVGMLSSNGNWYDGELTPDSMIHGVTHWQPFVTPRHPNIEKRAA
jgi:hypothetical protein